MLLALAALAVAPAATSRTPDRCAPVDSSLHWEAVFGNVTSLSQAMVVKQQATKAGFQGITFEYDSCDDVEVTIVGLDTATMRRDFAKEAAAFPVTFEPPDILIGHHPGFVKAVFGVDTTLRRADTLRARLARSGFHEGVDIERLSAHSWRVVLYNIPQKVTASFAAEAKKAGFGRISFLPM